MISDPESGEMVCSSCGLVLADNVVDTRAEWRNFGAETTHRIRAGASGTLARHDMGLATVIGRENTDAGGALLSATVRSAIGRWRTWDARSRAFSSSDRSLQRAFDALNRMRSKLNLSPAMVEKTAYLYRKAHEKRLARGRTVSALLGACVHISCRELGGSLSMNEIAQQVSIKRSNLGKMSRTVMMELDLKVPMLDPVLCIVKVGRKAGVSEKTKRRAIQMMKEEATEKKVAGKNPMGFAAAVLYMACLLSGEQTTQTILADAAGVTSVTIRNRIRDLKAQGISVQD